jgi:hypothetical protein
VIAKNFREILRERLFELLLWVLDCVEESMVGERCRPLHYSTLYSP